MTHPVSLHLIDLAVFVLYLLVTVALGLWVGRRGKDTAQGYFLGNKTLPWFVIGSSMVAADISSEQFISNVGGAYKYGIVLAAGDWNAWIIYSLLILIFLPYYVRTGIYTMPEFLERRYSPACRYIFAIASIAGYIAAVNAGALYSGGIMLDSFFGEDLSRLLPHLSLFGQPVSPVVMYIFFFALTTGLYTIYGGLKSAAWTDFLQIIVLLVAGVLVPILALAPSRQPGRLRAGASRAFPDVQTAHRTQYSLAPASLPAFSRSASGIAAPASTWSSACSAPRTNGMPASVWSAPASCTSSCPSSSSSPALSPSRCFPIWPGPTRAYLLLVKELIPTGLKGLLLAGMAAALMGHVATVLNSASTVVTIDLYKRLTRREVTDAQQVRFGRWSGVVVLLASIWVAISFTGNAARPLFEKIQTVFFFIAPPFAVIFTLGILWKRANAIGALFTIVLGLPLQLGAD